MNRPGQNSLIVALLKVSPDNESIAFAKASLRRDKNQASILTKLLQIEHDEETIALTAQLLNEKIHEGMGGVIAELLVSFLKTNPAHKSSIGFSKRWLDIVDRTNSCSAQFIEYVEGFLAERLSDGAE
jgi:hypothetical protein